MPDDVRTRGRGHRRGRGVTRCTTWSPARSSPQRRTSPAATAATCRTGRAHICENLRILGVDVDGAFAEYVVIPAVNAWVVGERIHPDAASIMEPFGNAVHAVFGTGGGEDIATNAVAVLGCGPIGLFAIGDRALARRPEGDRRRAERLPPRPGQARWAPTRWSTRRTRTRWMRCMDATEGTGRRSRAGDVRERARRSTRARGCSLTAAGCRCSVCPTEPVTLDLNDQVIFKEARLQGVTGRELFRTWQQTTTLLSTGRVDVAPIITHRFPLERSRRRSRRPPPAESGKVIILPGEVT